MNTLDIIKHLEHIVQTHSNIGVLSSGGLDSSVLIFLLLKLSQEHHINNKIKIFTVPRVDGSKNHSAEILSYLNNEFNIQLEHNIVGNINHSDPARQVVSGIIDALNDKSLDIVLAADTKMPDFEVIPGQANPVRVRGTMKRYDQPFFDYTKDYTVKLGIDYKLDEIFRRSHSCVVLDHGRCNHCWWCKERVWAFEKNNYADPGLN